MKIFNHGLKKEADDAGFILGNKLGGYLFLSNKPVSRYQGFFFMDDFRMFRTIEDLGVDRPVDEIEFNFNMVKRKRGDLTETFFLSGNSLIYDLNKKSEINLILDCKESYDNREFERIYEIKEADKKILIKFIKKNNRAEEYSVYLAIRADSLDYKKIEKWVERRYSFDERRNSPPFLRYVYSALKLNAKQAVFSASLNEEKALNEADYVFENIDLLKKKNLIKPNNKTNDKEVNLAYNCSALSLKNLTVLGNTSGILAGLPWFFQFWTRDELVSARAFDLINEKDFAKKLLMGQLNAITPDGRMYDRYPASGLKSADSPGWLFKRLSEINLNQKEKELVKGKLEFCLKGILKNHFEKGLVKNNLLETWMDTDFAGDNRAGFRIEIQAMQLFMYKLMHELSKDEKFKKREQRLRKKVRYHYWNGKVLSDGLRDHTVRPNIFIAYYFYPELLTHGEWRRCFERCLDKLWLEWGGLSTIEKDSPLFTNEYTGENNKSYHRGDSWFWLNNLAAICLARVDKKEFKDYIDKILKASTEEILYKGAIGTAGELSSAKELRSEGCLMQAWSNALYIELVEESF